MQRDRVDLAQLLLPLITIIGFVAVSGSDNLLMIVPMGAALVLSIGYSIYAAWKARDTERRR